MQDHRGSMRGALARTPPRTPPAATAPQRPPTVETINKTRGGAPLEVAFAAAAPAAAALQPPTATTPRRLKVRPLTNHVYSSVVT